MLTRDIWGKYEDGFETAGFDAFGVENVYELFSTFHCRPDGRLSVELLACFAEEWQIMASQPGAFKVARLLLSCRFVVSHSMIP